MNLSWTTRIGRNPRRAALVWLVVWTWAAVCGWSEAGLAAQATQSASGGAAAEEASAGAPVAAANDPDRAPLTVAAQERLRRPAYADQIGVDQKLGEQLPLELRFHDDQNQFVALGDYFDGQLPVVLSLNYSNCPRLCIVQFNNFVAALHGLGLKPGRDFQVVSISLDPQETPGTAAETKRKYLASYGDLATAAGWHFLVGNRSAIEQIANDCGIRYVYVPEQKFYSHPSAFVFCSPSGKIVRYLNGLDGDLPSQLKPAILDAAQGRVGSLVDRVLYFSGCYIWDPASGKYTGTAMQIMRWGGALTVLAIAAAVIPFWFRRPRGEQPPPPESVSETLLPRTEG